MGEISIKKYQMTQQEIWTYLVRSKKQQLVKKARKIAPEWVEGYNEMKRTFENIPRVENMSNSTGWKFVPIIGKSDDEDFFFRLSRQTFNVNSRLREEQNLAYLEERDTFHDWFGHVPMLCNKDFSTFLIRLGCLYLACKNDRQREMVSKFYWYTAEFGLIGTTEEPLVYGAGIMSSIEEFTYALSKKANRVPADWNVMVHTPYITDGFQNHYFVIENWKHLDHLLNELTIHILT